jgi:hypothetical protein
MRSLPKGQAQRFQALARKAMLGRDVGAEMEEFQRSLPTHLQKLMQDAPALSEEKTAGESLTSGGEPNRKNLWKRWFGKSGK